MTHRLQHRTLLYSLLAVSVGLSILALGVIDRREKAQISAICAEAYANARQATFGATDAKLKAKASFVYDFTTDAKLDGVNENTALPLASLTKLMTIRLTLKNVSPDTLYTVRADDLLSEASIGFVPGDQYLVRELVRAALVASSNNAAVMLSHASGLSDSTFLADMNSDAQMLGLTSLRYQSVTGLDANNETVATAFGSAHDILLLLQKDYADYPDLMTYGTHPTDTTRSATGKTIPLANTDLAIPELPVLLASKTGYTDVAGGNLAVLWRDPSGDMLGASVLGSTEDGRFSDMIRLHDAADAYLSAAAGLAKLCQ